MSIKVKNKGFKEELEKIGRLGEVFDEEITKEMNDMGLAWRDDIRVNINNVTGDLARSTKFEGTEKVGGNFLATISNNLDYAEHYEYGHRQEVGRYVPAIGKRLVKSFVPGKYIFRKARQRAKAGLPKRIKLAIKRAEDRLSD